MPKRLLGVYPSTLQLQFKLLKKSTTTLYTGGLTNIITAKGDGFPN